MKAGHIRSRQNDHIIKCATKLVDYWTKTAASELDLHELESYIIELKLHVDYRRDALSGKVVPKVMQKPKKQKTIGIISANRDQFFQEARNRKAEHFKYASNRVEIDGDWYVYFDRPELAMGMYIDSYQVWSGGERRKDFEKLKLVLDSRIR